MIDATEEERGQAIARVNAGGPVIRLLAITAIWLGRWQAGLNDRPPSIKPTARTASAQWASLLFDPDLVVPAAQEGVRRGRRWRLFERMRRQHREGEADAT